MWQIIPPGLSCTYSDAEGAVLVISAGYGQLAAALLLLALPLYAIAWRRIEGTGSIRRWCGDCGHDWREDPGGGLDYAGLTDYDPELCGECQYEKSHDQASKDSVPCRTIATSAVTEPGL
jgi:hypothetical protein